MNRKLENEVSQIFSLESVEMVIFEVHLLDIPTQQ